MGHLISFRHLWQVLILYIGLCRFVQNHKRSYFIKVLRKLAVLIRNRCVIGTELSNKKAVNINQRLFECEVLAGSK